MISRDISHRKRHEREMAERAERLRRRDLFRINHVGMALQRMRSPSLYLEEPLRALVASVVPRRAAFSRPPRAGGRRTRS